MLSPHGYYSIILFIFQDFSECRGKIIRVTFHSTLTPACDRRPYPPPPRPRKTTRSGRKPTRKRAKKRTAPAEPGRHYYFLIVVKCLIKIIVITKQYIFQCSIIATFYISNGLFFIKPIKPHNRNYYIFHEITPLFVFLHALRQNHKRQQKEEQNRIHRIYTPFQPTHTHTKAGLYFRPL